MRFPEHHSKQISRALYAFELLVVIVLIALAASTLAGPPPAPPPADADKDGEKRWVAKVIEVGKFAYDNYEAEEAELDNYSLSAPNRLEATPSQLIVTENSKLRLPGVEAKAGITWVPYKGKRTTVKYEFQVGDEASGSGSFGRTGRETEEEWEDWRNGDYPYSGTGFDNEHPIITFDITGEAEAFNEGVNAVKVKLWGTTYVERNIWNPLEWFESTPTEKKDFEEVIAQEKDVEVEKPYYVWKDPNRDVVVQPHPANLTMDLWSRNRARTEFDGNQQTYELPTVRLVCAGGTIPPDDNTSNNEMLVCSDTRTHSEAHPPEVIHVWPDFDPISVTVKYEDWDLAKNTKREYVRAISLRKTELFCYLDGEAEEEEAQPAESTGEAPERANIPRRSLVGQASRVADPEQPDQLYAIGDPVTVEIVSLELGLPTEIYDAGGDEEDMWSCQECVASGDVVELRYHFRDIFGRHFAEVLTVEVPAADDLAAGDILELPQPVLTMAQQEESGDGTVPVEIVALDLAGIAFGKMMPVEGIAIEDLGGLGGGTTDPTGRVWLDVPNGTSLQLAINDDTGRYRSMNLPVTPALLKPMTLLPGDDENPGGIDDRLYLWLNPDFDHGRLAAAVGQIRERFGQLEATIGAVSDLSADAVVEAIWMHDDGEPVCPAEVLSWGRSDGMDLGYVPVKFGLPAVGPDGPSSDDLVRFLETGFARLSVIDMEGEQSVVDVPVSYRFITGVESAELPNREQLVLTASPNPFNPMTTIAFEVPTAQRGRLVIYGLDGRRVRSLIDGWFDAGPGQVVWDGKNDRGSQAASGVYFARLTLGDEQAIRKVTMVK